MNVKVILLFLVNFAWCSHSTNEQETNPPAVSVTENAYVPIDNCSIVAKILLENNVTKCANEFQQTPFNGEITEESVFHYACYLVQRILTFLCQTKITLTTKDLNLDKVKVCPFSFIQISSLLGLDNNTLEQELTNDNHCQKVCYDLYKPKHQCVVLGGVIQYLSNLVSQSAQEKTKVQTELPVSPVQKVTSDVVAAKTEVHKTENSTKVKLPTESGTSVVQTSKAMQEENEKNFKETGETPDVTSEGKKSTDYNNQGSSKGVNDKMTSPENDMMKSKLEEQQQMYESEENMELEMDGMRPEINQLPDMQRVSEKEGNKEEMEKEVPMQEPATRNEIYSEGFFQAEESHFFFYFLMFSSVIVIGYLAFHNKNKILAYALEGSSGRRSRRRPNPARYRKLESNLEEAISSNTTQASASSVVY